MMNYSGHGYAEYSSADSTFVPDVTDEILSDMNITETDISLLIGQAALLGEDTPHAQPVYTDLTAMIDIPQAHGYDPPLSPPLSTVSTASVFSFPSPAATPEAAVPLAESLAESPNIDMISLFPSSDVVQKGVSSPPDAGKADIKEELAFRIRQRRQMSGLGEMEEDTKPAVNVLTSRDLVRRERRKASNRRAATKCRLKKKAAEEGMQSAMRRLRDENERLKQEVLALRGSKQDLEDRFTHHLSTCTHHQR